MIDESEDLKQDLKPNPQAIKVAAACEQIAPPNVNEKTFRNRSKSVSYTSIWSRQNSQTLNFPVKVQSWEPTLEKAIKAIVSIKANHVRSFDTETSG
jgi:hypothetical protein